MASTDVFLVPSKRRKGQHGVISADMTPFWPKS